MRATVVGSGVVGLTTAITLQRAGWQVRALTAAPIETLTSHLAAAVWFPTHTGPPEAVNRWGAHTFDVLAGLAEQPGSGVVMRESLALYDPHRQSPPGPRRCANCGRPSHTSFRTGTRTDCDFRSRSSRCRSTCPG